MTAEEIIENYVFLTAGACGPCRFGMYVTEYRKALRDAGFDGFRVVLFQQTGGLKQATGEGAGLEMNPTFFWALVKALVAGDVLNALGYRIRPYEVTAGDTDQRARAVQEDHLRRARGRRRTSSARSGSASRILAAREGRPHPAQAQGRASSASSGR